MLHQFHQQYGEGGVEAGLAAGGLDDMLGQGYPLRNESYLDTLEEHYCVYFPLEH